MRKRLDHRGVHCQDGIEKVRKADAVRLGDKAEEVSLAVKAPGPALFHNLHS